jgi:hypothetical protein
MRQILFLCLFSISCLNTLFPQEKIKRITITWDFYRRDKPNHSKHSAFTSYHFNLKTRLIKVVNNRLLLDFDVVFKLDTLKSYMDFAKMKKDESLLRHEQGHADIGILYARKLELSLKDAVFFKSGYNEKISKIFKEINSLMLKTNTNYDKETFFGTNEVKQEAWNKLLKRQF